MKRTVLMLALLVPIAAGARAESVTAAKDAKAPQFTLQDQYEKTVSLRQYEGRVVVLIASDKEGRPQNSAWIKAVRESYADRLVVQVIADVSSGPFFRK